MILSKLYYFS